MMGLPSGEKIVRICLLISMQFTADGQTGTVRRHRSRHIYSVARQKGCDDNRNGYFASFR